MDEEEMLKDMRKKIEVAKANHRVFEKTVSHLIQFINTDIPQTQLNMMIEPMKLSFESSKVNVERIGTFPSPTKESAMANFMFGKMFGKTELLLQIFLKQKR